MSIFEANTFLVDKLIKWQLEESDRSENGKLHVSSLVLCPLKEVFMHKFPELYKSRQYNGALLLGRLVHIGLQKVIPELLNGVEVESEVKVEKTVDLGHLTVTVSGKIDLVIKKNNKVIPVEIKTARSDHSLPKEHHIMQLKIYMNMLGAYEGYLIYVTPDRITEYRIVGPIDDVSLSKFIMSRREKAPLWDWECGYCVFSVVCPYKKHLRGSR